MSPMVSLYNPNPIQGLKFPISFIKFPFHIFCQLFLRFSFFSCTSINIGSIPIYHKDHVYWLVRHMTPTFLPRTLLTSVTLIFLKLPFDK